jgi:hypothetical protein
MCDHLADGRLTLAFTSGSPAAARYLRQCCMPACSVGRRGAAERSQSPVRMTPAPGTIQELGSCCTSPVSVLLLEQEQTSHSTLAKPACRGRGSAAWHRHGGVREDSGPCQLQRTGVSWKRDAYDCEVLSEGTHQRTAVVCTTAEKCSQVIMAQWCTGKTAVVVGSTAQSKLLPRTMDMWRCSPICGHGLSWYWPNLMQSHLLRECFCTCCRHRCRMLTCAASAALYAHDTHFQNRCSGTRICTGFSLKTVAHIEP